tara:strand:- start:860 stop:1861 length:1002 start_codon:yes stop_codon:yes gene_type:complete
MVKKLINLNEKIFLAGAKGMAGSAINRALIKHGYGQKKNGGEILRPQRNELNLLNYDELKIWFKKNKPTVVIIAAAKVGGIFANNNKPADFILENLKIQTNIIDISWKMGVKRLIFLGSSCIYPKFASQPIQEESLLTNSLEKTNEWYAIAKIAGIKLCEALRKQYHFDAISLMPTNLYGPGDNYHPQDSHVMASLIRKFYEASKYSFPQVICWGSGEPFREFMHVDDLGDGVVFALEYWDPDSRNAPLDKEGNPLTILNIGTGVDISIKELAHKISDMFRYKGEIIWDKCKPDGTPRKLLNISKINNLGWKHKINLDDGLNLILEDFNNKKF